MNRPTFPILPIQPDPQPGQTGHFVHHEWLSDAIKQLNILVEGTSGTEVIVTSDGLVKMLAALTVRVKNLEDKVVVMDNTISAIQTFDTSIDARATAVEKFDVAIDVRVTALEKKNP